MQFFIKKKNKEMRKDVIYLRNSSIFGRNKIKEFDRMKERLLKG